MPELVNFDALGLLCASDIRRHIKQSIPVWHLEGIPSISYRPGAFFPPCVGAKEVAIGLYDLATHEISVRYVNWNEIETRLSRLKNVLVGSEILSQLQNKNMLVGEAYLQFRKDEGQVLRTIYHEIGHNVYSLLLRRDPFFKDRWDCIYKNSKERVSSYADKNAEEDFAECYMIYVNDLDMIRRPQFHPEFNELRRWFLE